MNVSVTVYQDGCIFYSFQLLVNRASSFTPFDLTFVDQLGSPDPWRHICNYVFSWNIKELIPHFTPCRLDIILRSAKNKHQKELGAETL